MGKQLTEDQRLGAAILDVLTSLSQTNLSSGTTYTVTVPRVYIHELRDAFEAIYPGALARCRELQAGPTPPKGQAVTAAQKMAAARAARGEVQRAVQATREAR
jgi:hypothetical protein